MYALKILPDWNQKKIEKNRYDDSHYYRVAQKSLYQEEKLEYLYHTLTKYTDFSTADKGVLVIDIHKKNTEIFRLEVLLVIWIINVKSLIIYEKTTCPFFWLQINSRDYFQSIFQ
jgi:hypothetical protein